MNFIKKRIFLIVSVILVLAAGGLFFYGKKVEGKNVTNNQTVLSKYNQLSGLNRALVTENILNQLKTLAESASKDMEEVKIWTDQTTARPLLSNDIFPEPGGINQKVKFEKFARAYCLAVDRFMKKLSAGLPPSQLEEETLRININKKRSVSFGRSDPFESAMDFSFRPSSSSLGPRTDEQIEIDEFRKERATSFAIYSDTSSFFGYDFWDKPQNDDRDAMLFDTWFSQLAFWIQEDVVLAIAQINANSKMVANSPIKRLIEISFQGASVGTSGSVDNSVSYVIKTVSRFGAPNNVGADRRTNGSEVFLPEYILPPSAALGASMLGKTDKNVGQITNSWTRRISEGLVDVIQFELALIIDTMHIDPFINALQSEKMTNIIQNNSSQLNQSTRNQITVVQIMIEPINTELEKESGFYYGPGALAVLRLVGEYVFFKSGYESQMPQPVKDILNPPDDTDQNPGY